MGCTCANISHLNRPVQRYTGFGGSDLVRLVAGFRKEIGPKTSPVDGPTGWTGRSGPVFKTLLNYEGSKTSLKIFLRKVFERGIIKFLLPQHVFGTCGRK